MFVQECLWAGVRDDYLPGLGDKAVFFAWQIGVVLGMMSCKVELEGGGLFVLASWTRSLRLENLMVFT